MKPILILACLSLGGCSSLADFNAAVVPELKPIDAKIHTDRTCADVADGMLGVLGGAGVVPTADQYSKIVHLCEQRDATMTLQFNPEAGRKVIEGAMRKPVPIPGVP